LAKRRKSGAIGAVFTIARAAEILGEDEDLLFGISCDMTPEQGCVNVHGPGDEFTVAFTEDGIDKLVELIPLYKTRGMS
jgi:hypothetical protein